METVTVSSKGQIVIPASVRRSRKIKTGDRLIVEEGGDGILLRPLVKLSEMLGRYKVPGGTGALRAMRAANEREWIARISAIQK